MAAPKLEVDLILKVAQAEAAAKSFSASFKQIFASSPQLKMMIEFEAALARGERRVQQFQQNLQRSFEQMRQAAAKSVPADLQKAIGSSGVKIHIAGDNPNAEANRAAYEASRNIKMTGGGILTSPNATLAANERNKKDIGAVSDAISDQEKERAMAKNLFRSKVQFYKDLTFLFQPLLNPTSIWGNMFAARQTFSAFSTEEGQRRIGGGGAAGALKATAILQGAALAVGLSLKALEKVISFTISEIRKAIDFSAKLYAKSLESGLNLRFTALRQMTAQTLGVDEKDIFRFAQSAQVMRQLSGAANELAKNAPQLAYTSAQFKILEFDALAFGSKIATDVAPAFNKLIGALDNLVKSAIKHSTDIEIASRIAAGVLTFGASEVIRANLKMFASTSGISGSGAGSLGQPQSFMKQLGAGAFEHMGLVVAGGNRALDYARRTAVAVEKIANRPSSSNGRRPHPPILNPSFNMP